MNGINLCLSASKESSNKTRHLEFITKKRCLEERPAYLSWRVRDEWPGVGKVLFLADGVGNICAAH
jgi:hypothetical protein